jgi:hypothetical protein
MGMERREHIPETLELDEQDLLRTLMREYGRGRRLRLTARFLSWGTWLMRGVVRVVSKQDQKNRTRDCLLTL